MRSCHLSFVGSFVACCRERPFFVVHVEKSRWLRIGGPADANGHPDDQLLPASGADTVRASGTQAKGVETFRCSWSSGHTAVEGTEWLGRELWQQTHCTWQPSHQGSHLLVCLCVPGLGEEELEGTLSGRFLLATLAGPPYSLCPLSVPWPDSGKSELKV